MIFGDKISENAKKISENGSSSHSIDPFPFSALHFIRNRLIPTGEKLRFLFNFLKSFKLKKNMICDRQNFF